MRPRPQLPLHTIVAVLCLLLAVAGSLVATAGAAVPSAPPRPVVVADGGAHRQASQGSYCWESGNHGLCVDTLDPIEFAPRLPAPAGSTLTVRMGYPVEQLSASTGRGEELAAVPLGERSRKFEIELPRQRAGRIDLYLFARYDRGDGYFAIRVRQLGNGHG